MICDGTSSKAQLSIKQHPAKSTKAELVPGIDSLVPFRPVAWLGLGCFMCGKLPWHRRLTIFQQFLEIKENIRVLQDAHQSASQINDVVHDTQTHNCNKQQHQGVR